MNLAKVRPSLLGLLASGALLGLALPAAPSAAALPQANVESVDFVTPQIGFAVIASGAAAQPAPKLYETVDAGRNWAPVAGGLPTQSANPYMGATVAFATRSDGIALMFAGAGACQAGWDAYRTANGGRTWRPAGKILGSDGPIAAAAAAGASPWLLNGSCAGPYAQLYRNSGTTWPQARMFQLSAAAAKTHFSPSAVSLQRYDGRRAFLAIAYYPGQPGPGTPLITGFGTASGGAAWQAVAIGSRALRGTVRAVGFYSAALGLAAVATQNGSTSLQLTRDHGATWLPVQGVRIPNAGYIPYVRSIQWLSPQVADVVVGQTLWRTADGGGTWRAITRVWPN